MNDKHTVLYVMRHVDVVLGTELPYKKIGITGKGSATLSNRISQLSNTKSPIQVQCEAAWEVNDARAVESALHDLLSDLNAYGEWFIDKNNQLEENMRPLMELLGATPIELASSNDKVTKEFEAKEKHNIQDRYATTLSKLEPLLVDQLSSHFTKKGITIAGNNASYFIRERGNEYMIYMGKISLEEVQKRFNHEAFEIVTDHKNRPRINHLLIEQVASIINTIQ